MRLSVLLVVAALALCSAQFSPHARGDWSSPPVADTGAGGVGLDLGNLFHDLVRDDADALELHSNAQAAEDMEELDSLHERMSPLFHSIFDRLRGMVETRGEAEDHEAHVDPRLARRSRAVLRVLRAHCNDVLGMNCPEAQTRDQMVTCLVRAGSQQPLEAQCQGVLHQVLAGNNAQVVAEASSEGGEGGADALGGHYQRLRDMFRGVRDMFGVGDGSDMPPPPPMMGGATGEPPMPPGHEKMPGEHHPPPPPPPHQRRGHRGLIGRHHGAPPTGHGPPHGGAEEDEDDVTDVAKVGELHNEIKCRREADRLCAATHGRDRHKCMLKSVDNVSPLCKKMLVARVLGPCADEAERMCAHTTAGERVGESTVQCLLDHRDAMNDECNKRLAMLMHVEEDEQAAALRERAKKAAEKAKKHREHHDKHKKKKKQHKHKHRRHEEAEEEEEEAAARAHDRTEPSTPSSSVGMIVAAVCAGMVLMAGVMLAVMRYQRRSRRAAAGAAAVAVEMGTPGHTTVLRERAQPAPTDEGSASGMGGSSSASDSDESAVMV